LEHPVTDQLADVLHTPSEDGDMNLQREGIPPEKTATASVSFGKSRFWTARFDALACGAIREKSHPPGVARVSIHHLLKQWCMIISMSRTNIDIDEGLIRQARKLTRLKTKRQIVDRALDLLVRSESRKGILRYYGAGIWKGDLKTSRRNRS
jgi:Arc/MetJ family transcription regulator